MVRLRAVVEVLLTFAALFVAPPALLLWLCSSAFGFSAEVVLAFVMLLEVYALVIEAEVSMRHVTLAKAEYEPVLAAYVSFDAERRLAIIELRNFGDGSALNVTYGLLDRDAGEPLYDRVEHLARLPLHLRPGASTALFRMREEEFRERSLRLNVFYVNELGELSEAVFVKDRGRDYFLTILPRHRMPGLLLGALEAIYSLVQLLRWRKVLSETGAREIS